jgi:hypothetical protein
MSSAERPDIEGLRDTYNRYVYLVNAVHATLETIKEAFPALHDYILELEAEREPRGAAVALVERATVYDYNRNGVLAFKVGDSLDIAPWKALADEHTPLMLLIGRVDAERDAAGKEYVNE